MKAPQYVVVNPEVQRYHKYSLSLHLSKLRDIKDRKSLVTASTPCPILRSNNKYFQTSNYYLEKKQEIYLKNKVLFQKLLNISEQSGVKHKKSMHGQIFGNFKSSNEIIRKNRTRQIAFENMQIVKKLIDIKPILEKKTLDKEYQEYKKRKKRLVKLGPIDTAKSFDCIHSSINT